MPESLKIKYYQDGILDPFFNTVRLSIQISPHLFATFDQVKDHYTTFKRNTSAFDNPGTTRRGILSFGRGGPGRGRDGGGHGGNDQRPRKPTQEEIDACTHIKARRYDASEYKLFTAAKKAKHYQLMHPTKTPRGMEHKRGGDRTSADGRDRKGPHSTVSEASSKCAKVEEDEHLLTTDDESAASTNRKNKALTRSSPSGRQKKSDE